MSDATKDIAETAAETARPKTMRRSRPRSRPPGSPAPLQVDTGRAVKPEAGDRNSLNAWLKAQSPEDLIPIAVRTALRGAPLAIRLRPKGPSAKDVAPFLVVTGALFRACALARIAAKYPSRANELHAAAQAAATRVAAAPVAAALVGAGSASGPGLGAVAAALTAALAAADAAALAAPFASLGAAPFATPVVASFCADAATFVAAIAANDAPSRMEIRSDASALQKAGAFRLADSPLWSQGRPDWAWDAWEGLKAALPGDEGWDVWIEWYEDRLRGGSRGEAYELVFASAPLDVWQEGPAAANGWIKEHLP